MWCNLGKSVWSQTCDIFSFLWDWIAHLERYILLKTPPELDQWFHSYEQLKDSQNNRKQNKFISCSGYISQSKLQTSNGFRLMATHVIKPNDNNNVVFVKDRLLTLYLVTVFLVNLSFGLAMFLEGIQPLLPVVQKLSLRNTIPHCSAGTCTRLHERKRH